MLPSGPVVVAKLTLRIVFGDVGTEGTDLNGWRTRFLQDPFFPVLSSFLCILKANNAFLQDDAKTLRTKQWSRGSLRAHVRATTAKKAKPRGGTSDSYDRSFGMLLKRFQLLFHEKLRSLYPQVDGSSGGNRKVTGKGTPHTS